MESKRNDVRKPPVNAVYAARRPLADGCCGWCGLPCDERTPVRKQLRKTHYACSAEIGIVANPGDARWAVENRDQGICVDCGEDWSDRYRASKGSSGTVGGLEWSATRAVEIAYRQDRELGFYRYTEVRWISLWHVDHRVPLWKVAHLPPLERIEFFKLQNLVTRCERCHAFKTKAEAAERAHFDRLAETRSPDASPKHRWGPRPMGKGRGFPPRGSRPMRRKKA